MIYSDMFESLHLLIASLIIVWFFYGPWQEIITSITRQLLFEIRDDVFDMARNRALDFESDEYLRIRKSLNSIIRFTHHTTWPRLLTFKLFSKKRSDTGVFDIINQIDDVEVKQKIKNKFHYATMFVIASIWLRSPLLIIITLAILVIALALVLVNARRAITFLKKHAAEIEKQIMYESSLAI